MSAQSGWRFCGSQLTLLGRYNGDGPAQVVLRGTANGKEVIFEYSADFPRVERDNPFIPRLWATRRIGWLLDQIRLHGQDKELVEEVVRLATRYGILTPYTSYLVLEPGVTTGVPADEPLVRADLRRQASDRVSAGRAGGALPSAAPAGSAGPVGDGAIHRSEAAKTMRSAEQAAQSGNGAVQTKIAGETTFYQLGDTWVQSTYPKDTAGWRVIKVKYGSDAWSDLLGLRKDMQQVLAVGQQLKAQFGKVLLVVGDDGLEKLGDDERRALKE